MATYIGSYYGIVGLMKNADNNPSAPTPNLKISDEKQNII